MKNLIITIGNLIISIFYFPYSLVCTLWYGKLPKVSLYHWFWSEGKYKVKDVFNNPTIHAKSSVEKEVQLFKDFLLENEEFRKANSSCKVNIYSGNDGGIIGSTSLNSLIDSIYRQFNEEQSK
jgi:hypothetical protein